MAKLRSWTRLAIGVLASVAPLVACNGQRREDAPATPHTPSSAAVKSATQVLQDAFPRAKLDAPLGHPTRLYGSALASGRTVEESAERFRLAHTAALGMPAAELVPRQFAQSGALPPATTTPRPLGLMYDRKTGQYKFFLYRYGQAKSGVPVFRSGLLTLVKNQGNHPVVWASSFVHDLSTFVVPNASPSAPADPDKSLQAIRGMTDSSGRLLPAPRRIARLSATSPVVFAGKEGRNERPRLAIAYTVETAEPRQTWQLVADAATRDVLHAENSIVFENVTGTVSGFGTQGTRAMDCAEEVATPFPYAEVTDDESSAFTDLAGNFELSNSGSTAVSLSSLPGGQYFDVLNAAGTTEQLLSTVTPPGPANFLHNPDDASDLLRAQVNAYLSANQVRSFLLQYVPSYPVISTEQNFPINVNRNDLYCPGNAWYDGSSLNFCVSSSSYANTAFASVAYYEYGHHIVSAGGSGQGEYGEGMGDTVSSLLAGEPGLSYGFLLNQCSTPLRNADNTCQYSASSCSSCGSEAHDCGNLLSGTMWSIRKALAASDPDSYVDLIDSLALNSIPLHVGSSISPSIAVDLLTIDDDDANIDNGTPHYTQICAGFAAHGMSCPPRLTGLSVTPAALAAKGPTGGPFSPESVSYTLKNLGPAPTISYSVAPLEPAPWLSITNATGQLAVGQQALVMVAIDQASASALANGNYQATLQFSNLNDGTGNTTQTAQLEVGVTPLFSEDFSAGMGQFSLGFESTNRWHVTSGCASTLGNHSAPASLYFGVDASCNYDGGASVGTATSPPIDVRNSSVVKLHFNYYLQTERASSFDSATVQVALDDGAYTTVASNNAAGTALLDGSGSWQAAEVDLSPLFLGQPSAKLRVKFGFDTVDSIANAFTGFMVDDVEVRGFVTSCTSNAQCDDGAFCNGVEQCSSGKCVAGTPVDCSDGVACTQDSCDEPSRACMHRVSDAACDDGQACNGNETCNATLGCQSGAPLLCDDGNACTADSCDPTLGCQHSDVSCDDSNACTTDSCSGALGCQHTAVTCDDANACTIDSCSPEMGCQHSNGSDACADDGNSCTADVCNAGACTHPDNGSCSLGAFQESGGQVVMEAEHFSLDTARANHTWDATSDSSASGALCMSANPNIGSTLDTGYTAGSPQLDFPVTFTTTGTYQVWVRGSGAGSADRTVHAGLDGVGLTTCDRITGFSSAYAWSKSTLDGPVATINVTRAGLHTVNLWMRDDGFRVDRLLLTTNTGFVPSGAGPAESARGQACAASGGCAAAPCSSFCSNPILFSGGLQSGNLGTSATCYQTTAAINGGNCGNFLSSRTLSINGTKMTCNSGNWPTIPAKVNGGYCVYTSAGGQPWSYFTTW